MAAMHLGEPVSAARLAWLKQVAEESKVADSTAARQVLVYVTDQNDRWKSKVFAMPKPSEPFLNIWAEYPEHEIVDVHITTDSVHIYIRRVNGI